MLSLIVSVGVSAETTSMWSGNFEFASDGTSSFPDIAKEKFANLKLGDKIVVTVSEKTNPDGWAQINLAGKDPWTTVPGTNWSDVKVGENKYEISDETVLASIKKGGLGIQGKYFKMTDVSILSPSSACVWSGEYSFPAEEGWAEVSADKFSNLELGDYLVVRVKELTDEGAQINMAGRNPWTVVPGTNWSDAKVGDNSYVINDADVLASIKAGGLGIQGKYYTFTNVYIAKPIIIRITDAGIGSMILPFAADVPEGMKVYAFDSYDGNGVLKMKSVDAIVANTPYIIKGETDNYKFVGVAKAENFQYTVENLTGTYEDIMAPVGRFVLQNGTSGAGFYRVAEGKQPTVRAHHAYLTLPENNANQIRLQFDDETGIESLNAIESVGATQAYNLAGQRVSADAKGIVIMNGKKFLVK